MIRVGTCSWTEKTLIKSGEFYPRDTRTAEGRLKYYASQFDTVEVDSTYYAIPDKKNVRLWSERTPDNFIFHVKAYGALTGHPVDPGSLPADIREMLSADEKKKARIFIREEKLFLAVAEKFLDALSPFVEDGKLGLLVFQFPPWLAYGKANLDTIIRCGELMRGLSVAIEFRHGSWLQRDRKDEVLQLLKEHQLTYIAADEPQYGTLETIPFVPAVTSDIAYFRFHGRNTENWMKKGIATSLRFAYRYSEQELESFVAAIAAVSGKAKQVYAMFNNCHGGSAMKNALKLKEMLAKKVRDELYEKSQ